MTMKLDQLALLSPESETEFRQCFMEDQQTGRMRFTPKGYAQYGERFARAGIDINKIRTRETFREACIKSEGVVFGDLQLMVKGHKVLEDALKPLCS